MPVDPTAGRVGAFAKPDPDHTGMVSEWWVGAEQGSVDPPYLGHSASSVSRAPCLQSREDLPVGSGRGRPSVLLCVPVRVRDSQASVGKLLLKALIN